MPKLSAPLFVKGILTKGIKYRDFIKSRILGFLLFIDLNRHHFDYGIMYQVIFFRVSAVVLILPIIFGKLLKNEKIIVMAGFTLFLNYRIFDISKLHLFAKDNLDLMGLFIIWLKTLLALGENAALHSFFLRPRLLGLLKFLFVWLSVKDCDIMM